MAKSIRLSPKHGVNPSIPICFFCGKEKNEIAILGRLPQDAEAPRNILLDYEPCDACKTAMEQGITLIGVTKTPNFENQPEITSGAYPTGQWAVIQEKAACDLFSDPEMCKKVIQTRKCLMSQEILDKILPTDDSHDM